MGRLLQGREACVIGFGKVGNSVARTLHAKSVRVTIYDESPVRMTHALSQGFQTACSRAEAVRRAHLVVCATGNVSLRSEDFSSLRNGAYVVSVTSSDDELEVGGLSERYDHCSVGPHVVRYSTMYQYFYLVNNGNAINFLHGAVVGPFIFLVQAEILAAISLLARGEGGGGLCEVGNEERAFIAQTWLDHFNG
jgi:adenosylhomocysteinase